MDKIKEYWAIIAFAILLIFAAGNAQQKDKSQDTNIASVKDDLSATKEDVKENTKSIHAEEIRSARQETNQVNIMNALEKLDIKLDSWEPTKPKEIK